MDACERYLLTVGIIGPIGVGPITADRYVTTSYHKTAPPKNLSVMQGPENPLAILIQWSASCQPIDTKIGYIVSGKNYVLLIVLINQTFR